MSSWMISVVESRDVLTRITISNEVMARDAFKDLRARKNQHGWLAVSLSQVAELPVRSNDEKARAIKLMYL